MAEIADPDATTSGANLIRKTTLSYIMENIQEEAIDQHRPILISTLMNMFKTDFIARGGKEEEAKLYTSQNLRRKIFQQFGKKTVTKLANQRDGNFI